MPTYEGTAVKDKAVVRKSPATGMKIGALKAGISIKGDRVENGSDGKPYVHIYEPMDGWVLTSEVRYIVSNIIAEPQPSVNQQTTKKPTSPTVLANTPTVSGDLFMVRKWGDPLMKEYSFTLEAFPTLNSNFQAIPLYDEEGNGGGIQNFIKINKAQIDHLKSLQPKEDNHPLKAKLNWLGGTERGRPYMWEEGEGDLITANAIRWQAIIYGGAPVIVLETLDIPMLKLPDHKKDTIKVARILLYDMDNPDERAIQQATSVRGLDKFIDKPQGMVIHAPIWKGKFEFIPVVWLEEPQKTTS